MNIKTALATALIVSLAWSGTDRVIAKDSVLRVSKVKDKRIYPVKIKNKKAAVPEGITELADGCFYRCKEMRKISLPSSLKKIGKFALCRTGLLEVVIPEGVEVIGDECFQYSLDLEKVTLPSTLREIGEQAFMMTKIREIEIPEGITKIKDRCFQACNKLKKVVLPSTLKEIGDVAFGWSDLEEIVIPEGVEMIGIECFRGCKKLKRVVLPSTLETLGYGAFVDTGIKEIEIPNGITVFPNYADPMRCFRGGKNQNLKSITLPSTLEIIKSETFEEVTLEEIKIRMVKGDNSNPAELKERFKWMIKAAGAKLSENCRIEVI